MTTTAIEKQDASATVAALTARLTDAQERLAATGPEHARLRQERRDAFEAGQDTEPLDGQLARLDRDAQDLDAIIARVSAELATATAAQLKADVDQARLDRARAEVHHMELGRAAILTITKTLKAELGKRDVAYADFEAAHAQLGALTGSTPTLFDNAIFARLGALAYDLDERGTHDVDIELESARNRLAQLEAAP